MSQRGVVAMIFDLLTSTGRHVSRDPGVFHVSSELYEPVVHDLRADTGQAEIVPHG